MKHKTPRVGLMQALRDEGFSEEQADDLLVEMMGFFTAFLRERGLLPKLRSTH